MISWQENSLHCVILLSTSNVTYVSLSDRSIRSRDEISQMFVRDQRYRITCCLKMEMLSLIYVLDIYAAIIQEAQTKKFSVELSRSWRYARKISDDPSAFRIRARSNSLLLYYIFVI